MMDTLDCEQAFDLFAFTATAACATPSDDSAAGEAEDKLAAAQARLIAAGAFEARDFAGVSIRWCRLVTGTGMVTGPRTLYLNSALRQMSVDGVAEVLAHELVHVRQFERLGPRGFKCDYVRDYVACGGCQDRRHPLEQQAYDVQDLVRERLLEEALGK